MKVGDLVGCIRYSRLGVVTRCPVGLRGTVPFQSQTGPVVGSIIEVLWTDMEKTSWCDVASLEVVDESG